MPRPSYPPCFDHPNNTGRRVQTMQLLIMQFSPTTCHLKILKLIIPENASVLHSYDENPKQNFFLNSICLFFPVGASICKRFEEPAFEQTTYVRNIPLFNQCPLLLKNELLLC
jgi:hypothetical protein